MQLHSAARTARDRIPLSVVITNFNYVRYLPIAIESALSQDLPVDLIVVDDRSTDGSRDLIRSYSTQLTPVMLDENAGQGAGFNAGFAAARGDLVMFLDADDFLLPGAAARIVANRKPDTSLYLYPMRYADETGSLFGMHPPHGFSTGDISGLLRKTGRYHGTITSGMVFDRNILGTFMPMETDGFRQGADGYLAVLAPLYGRVSAESDIISAYRLHAEQHTRSAPDAFAARARYRIRHDAARYRILSEHSRKLGLPVAPDLGRHDDHHIKERLISLMFDPAQHPCPEDTEQGLLRESRRIALQHQTGLRTYFRAAWWALLSLLPPAARRRMFSYELHPASRPAWFTKLARALKKPR